MTFGRPGGLAGFKQGQYLSPANPQNSTIDIIGESAPGANRLAAFSPTENENPGALAGATGADDFPNFVTEEYLNRAEAATALCHAIADADRDDAVFLMDAALERLSVGAPLPVFLDALDDAKWWASFAAPHELRAFAFAIYQAMTKQMRARFREYVLREEAA